MEDLTVLYKSENYIVVDKGYDTKINSNEADEGETVETKLCRLFPHLRDERLCHSFRFSHRLDYATSGVLCLALNKKAARKVQRAFSRREVVKHYLALVRGYVDFDERKLDLPIGRNSHVTDFHKMCATGSPGCLNPRPCQTLLIRLEHGTYDHEPASKLLLIPQTGRTHQLRVHCAHIQHPVIGDYTYTNRQDTKPFRMMLHSYRLQVLTALEPLDVQASDPFTHEQSKWKPHTIFTSYQGALNSCKS